MAKRTKGSGRPKPMVHTPSMTKNPRRLGCGGKIKK